MSSQAYFAYDASKWTERKNEEMSKSDITEENIESHIIAGHLKMLKRRGVVFGVSKKNGGKGLGGGVYYYKRGEVPEKPDFAFLDEEIKIVLQCAANPMDTQLLAHVTDLLGVMMNQGGAPFFLDLLGIYQQMSNGIKTGFDTKKFCASKGWKKVKSFNDVPQDVRKSGLSFLIYDE